MADTAHSRTIGERTPKRSISKMIPSFTRVEEGIPDKVKMHRDNLTMSYSYQEEEKWFINVALRGNFRGNKQNTQSTLYPISNPANSVEERLYRFEQQIAFS